MNQFTYDEQVERLAKAMAGEPPFLSNPSYWRSEAIRCLAAIGIKSPKPKWPSDEVMYRLALHFKAGRDTHDDLRAVVAKTLQEHDSIIQAAIDHRNRYRVPGHCPVCVAVEEAGL